MAQIQTAIRNRISAYRAGMIPEGGVTKRRTYETSGSGMKPGVAVRQGANADQIQLGVTGASSNPRAVTSFLGIVVRDRTRRESVTGVPDGNYAMGVNVEVLYEGPIAVQVDAAVSVGDDVTVNNGTGVLSSKTVSSTQSLIPRARWITAAAANGIAIVELGTEQVGGA